jgi:hypothetical protein
VCILLIKVPAFKREVSVNREQGCNTVVATCDILYYCQVYDHVVFV